MTGLPDGPLVAWYGDDFTGAAATMEVLSFAGLPSVLFTDIPSPAERARFPHARGIGIASTARAQNPEWMRANLPDAFDALTATGAPVLHYKVCSTLDSSPATGSIGCAMDIAEDRIGSGWVPVFLAAPAMRRYQCFGQLFAGAPEGVFRLDRHPVMSRHPVTPMDEADVARHLARQSDAPIGCLDIEALEKDAEAALDRALSDGTRRLTLDTLSPAHLETVGGLIWTRRGERLIVVGSQGVEYALVAHWQATGAISPAPAATGAGAADRMIAVSGSVSPITAAQIEWAEANGFAVIVADAARLAQGDRNAEEALADEALGSIAAGRDPLIVTARGPDDPAVARFRATIAAAGLGDGAANTAVGQALGRILAGLLRQTGIRRAVISGGDTSGHATRELGLYAFTALAPTIPGAALLTAHSEDPAFDGLQIALKGGQMGSPDYFGWIRRGGGPAT